MEKMRITGGIPLRGKITISGAKNAALKLMAASLLSAEKVTLHNVPQLADIATMANLLAQHGVTVGINGHNENTDNCGYTLELQAREITSIIAPYELVHKMRASIVVLGPLLARCHEAKVSLPGGDAIGLRPVDLHIKALEQMGAEIRVEQGYVHALARGGLHGAEINFPIVTVTGTENALMAATLAKGKTIIRNAAREPEVADLAHCLIAMGANISGVGTSEMHIVGQTALHGGVHTVIPDRIEAGTYAMAAALTDGDVELIGGRLDHLPTARDIMAEAGVLLEATDRGFRAYRAVGGLKAVDVTTNPFPGFATDLQAQFMAIMCLAKGSSTISETIFENRFMHAPELMRMGANIEIHNSVAVVHGVDELNGAPVMATDIRASVSLVLAALAAKGDTVLNQIYHLDRGYERLEEKLGACGAQITRLKVAA